MAESKSKRHEDKKKKHKKHKKSSSKKSKTSKDDRVRQISIDDYFQLITEFRVWLKLEKKCYFEDLTSDETTDIFENKFMRKWNANKLDDMYYTGIPEEVLETIQRTKHKWKFVQKLNDEERFQLATTKDSVTVSTNKKGIAEPLSYQQKNSDTYKQKAPKNQDDETYERELEQDKRKIDRKKLTSHHKMVMEELQPRATGREAKIEKKREKSRKIHSAAKSKEDAQDGLSLGDDFLMGGGNDDFQARIQKRKQRAEEKNESKRQKLSEYQEKEANRMEKFLKDMGLKAGQRVTIQPRK